MSIRENGGDSTARQFASYEQVAASVKARNVWVVHAAIDFGISNTDAVAYVEGALRHWTRPTEGDLDHKLTQAVLATGGVELSSLQRLAITGGRHRLLPSQVGACAVAAVDEVQAIGRGGHALASVLEAEDPTPVLVVSAGSGTAVVATRGDQYAHVMGTGVGGGTLLGLSRLLLGTVDHHEIDALAQRGDPNGADLNLGDAIGVPLGRLARRALTASREDLAAALVTLVSQVIALIAINAARAERIERVVVTGHLIDMVSVRDALTLVGDYRVTTQVGSFRAPAATRQQQKDSRKAAKNAKEEARQHFFTPFAPLCESGWQTSV